MKLPLVRPPRERCRGGRGQARRRSADAGRGQPAVAGNARLASELCRHRPDSRRCTRLGAEAGLGCRLGLSDADGVGVADQDVDLVARLQAIEFVVVSVELQLAGQRLPGLWRRVAQMDDRFARDVLVALLSNLLPLVDRIAGIGVNALVGRFVIFVVGRFDDLAIAVDGGDRRGRPLGIRCATGETTAGRQDREVNTPPPECLTLR